MRIFVWHIENRERDGTYQGPAYIADCDYTLPGMVRMYARNKPQKNELEIDIKVDGESIMDKHATMPKGVNDDFDEGFIEGLVLCGSVISLDIIQDGGAKGITVQLELNELADGFET